LLQENPRKRSAVSFSSHRTNLFHHGVEMSSASCAAALLGRWAKEKCQGNFCLRRKLASDSHHPFAPHTGTFPVVRRYTVCLTQAAVAPGGDFSHFWGEIHPADQIPK